MGFLCVRIYVSPSVPVSYGFFFSIFLFSPTLIRLFLFLDVCFLMIKKKCVDLSGRSRDLGGVGEGETIKYIV